LYPQVAVVEPLCWECVCGRVDDGVVVGVNRLAVVWCAA